MSRGQVHQPRRHGVGEPGLEHLVEPGKDQKSDQRQHRAHDRFGQISQPVLLHRAAQQDGHSQTTSSARRLSSRLSKSPSAIQCGLCSGFAARCHEVTEDENLFADRSHRANELRQAGLDQHPPSGWTVSGRPSEKLLALAARHRRTRGASRTSQECSMPSMVTSLSATEGTIELGVTTC